MLTSIQNKVPYKIDKIKKTDWGLTNTNYIIDILNDKYILRFPHSDIKHLFNPIQEKLVIKKLENTDYTLPVIYYKDRIQITKYINNLKTFDDMNKETRIKAVADLMNKFHKSDLKVDFNFSPLKQIQLYKDEIKDLKIDLNDYQDLFEKLENHHFEPILCHNDWVAGNICKIDNKAYLIDFEYAGNNDRLFDIMSFLTENDLSKDERLEFLNYMFKDGINEEDYETLKMYRDTNNLLWYLWAVMMHQFRGLDIYDEIAEIKLKQLLSEYNQDLWDKL